MQMQSVDEFVESILDDKGITNVDPEIRQELKEDMKKRLMEQINRAAVMQLSKEKATELEKLMNEPDFSTEKMTEFMKNSGVNLSEVVLDTMIQFRGYYMGAEE